MKFSGPGVVSCPIDRHLTPSTASLTSALLASAIAGGLQCSVGKGGEEAEIHTERG